MRLRSVVALSVLLCAAAPAPQLTTPATWKWITDEPAELVTGDESPPGSWRFVAMPPGFHITTGPGATLYKPAHLASARFTLSAHVFIFPDAGDGGYGLFVGGQDMDSAAPARVEFLLRPDGTTSIVKRQGGTVTTLLDWTAHQVIARPSGEDTGANDVVIEASLAEVTFKVNGEVIAVLPRAELNVDGHFGIRLSGATNIHISSFDLTSHLAPPRG